MTVGQLKEKLSKLNDNMSVVLDNSRGAFKGYEYYTTGVTVYPDENQVQINANYVKCYDEW